MASAAVHLKAMVLLLLMHCILLLLLFLFIFCGGGGGEVVFLVWSLFCIAVLRQKHNLKLSMHYKE